MLAHRSGGFVSGGAGSDSGAGGSASAGGSSDVVLIADRQEEMSLDELFAHMARLKGDPGVWEQVLSSLDVDVLTAGLALVGDIVCGAALSVEASDDAMGEALRIAEGARLIAAASGGLP